MLLELKTVYSEMEAHILITHLKDENIYAIIDKDDAGGMHPQLQAARGVKILVNEDDLQKAKRVIEVDNTNKDFWTCNKCNEVHEGQFSVCWNCGEKQL